jgi:hypothetical protein
MVRRSLLLLTFLVTLAAPASADAEPGWSGTVTTKLEPNYVEPGQLTNTATLTLNGQATRARQEVDAHGHHHGVWTQAAPLAWSYGAGLS